MLQFRAYASVSHARGDESASYRSVVGGASGSASIRKRDQQRQTETVDSIEVEISAAAFFAERLNAAPVAVTPSDAAAAQEDTPSAEPEPSDARKQADGTADAGAAEAIADADGVDEDYLEADDDADEADDFLRGKPRESRMERRFRRENELESGERTSAHVEGDTGLQSAPQPDVRGRIHCRKRWGAMRAWKRSNGDLPRDSKQVSESVEAIISELGPIPEDRRERIAKAMEYFEASKKVNAAGANKYTEREVASTLHHLVLAKRRSPKRKPLGERHAHKMRASVVEAAERAEEDGEEVDSRISEAAHHSRRTVRQQEAAATNRNAKTLHEAYRIMEKRREGEMVRKAVERAGLERPPVRFSSEFNMRCYFDEADLAEYSVRGRGPGGQATNRRRQTCLLKHIPSGIVVRQSKFPSLHLNRKLARHQLNQRIEYFFLGDLSALGRKRALMHRKSQHRQARHDAQQERADEIQSVASEKQHNRPHVLVGDGACDFVLGATAESIIAGGAVTAVHVDGTPAVPPDHVDLGGDSSRPAFPYLPLRALSSAVPLAVAGVFEPTDLVATVPSSMAQCAPPGTESEEQLAKATASALQVANLALAGEATECPEQAFANPPVTTMTQADVAAAITFSSLNDEPLRSSWVPILTAAWDRAGSGMHSVHRSVPPLWFRLAFPAPRSLAVVGPQTEAELREHVALAATKALDDKVMVSLRSFAEYFGLDVLQNATPSEPTPKKLKKSKALKKKKRTGSSPHSTDAAASTGSVKRSDFALDVTAQAAWIERAPTLQHEAVVAAWLWVYRSAAARESTLLLAVAIERFFATKADSSAKSEPAAATPTAQRLAGRRKQAAEGCAAISQAITDIQK